LKRGQPITTDARWSGLLALGEQLLEEPSILHQHDLIIQQMGTLLQAQVELYLSEEIYRLPGKEPHPIYTNQKPTRLIQSALKTRQVQTTPKREPGPVNLAVPLQAQGTLLGAIQTRRPNYHSFSPADLQFIETAANYLAGSLHVTHQVAIKNWRLEQLSLMREVSAQLVHISDLDELAHRVTQKIQDAFQYYYVAIFTLEPGENRLRFRANANAQESQEENPSIPRIMDVLLGEGIIGTVAQSGKEILAADVQHDLRYRYVDTLPETHSEFALPFKIGDRTLGVLDVQSNQPNAFHEIDQLVLRALTDNIAIAIEGTRLYSNLRKRAEQIATVTEVSRSITSILDVDDVIKEVVTLLHERFGYPYVHVFTVHQGRRKVLYAAGSGPRSKAFAETGLAYDLDDPSGIIPWVAREGKTLVANDVSTEKRYRPTELPPLDTRAELAVPFLFNGEVLGLLDIQSDQVNIFAEDDLYIFETLAANVAVAMRNALLYKSEKWRRQVAESLRDVASLLSANVGLDQVLEAILTELERNLPCAVAAIWLVGNDLAEADEENSQNLRLAAIHGVNEEEVRRVREVTADDDDLLTKTLISPEPIIRSPDDRVGPLGMALGYAQDYSSIATPMRTGDQPLGLVALAHPDAGRYGAEAQRMTAAFASYAAVAIENTRLYASAQEQAWVSTVMLQVAEATQTYETLDELLSAVVRLAPMLVGVRGSGIFLWNAAAESFHLAASYGLEETQQADFEARAIQIGDALAFDQVRFQKDPVFVHDCQNDLGFGEAAACQSDHFDFVLFPLHTRGELLGAFLVEQRGRSTPADADSFGSERLAILQGIIQQTAVAVENIRLLESKQEEAYVTAVLLQVAQAVVSSNDLGDILGSIVHLMPILVGIDFNAIYLWDAQQKHYHPAQIYIGSWKLEEDLISRDIPQGDFPLLDAVLSTQAMVACPLGTPTPFPGQWLTLPLPEDPEAQEASLKENQDLLIGFPLSVKGDRYGVLLAQESGADPAFRERRIEIITGVAQQASLAIQNDRLNQEMVVRERLEREFQLAREIQRTFLPTQIPEPKGWDLDVRWRPAREVGGDFYDAFELPGNRLGLVIADVSDKGMPAALYMTVTRTLIRAAAQEEESPARVLERVNNLLLMDSQYGMFVTCVYAIVSLKTGRVTYANAGHNIPLILRGNSGVVESLKKGSMAMAVLENNLQVDQTVTLEPGDILMLFTDGVTEAFSAEDELYGDQRLLASMTCCPVDSASDLLDNLDQSLGEFIHGAPASDDITLIALRRGKK
jgi:GAF domain-containing protein